jgi:hypothetical protein
MSDTIHQQEAGRIKALRTAIMVAVEHAGQPIAPDDVASGLKAVLPNIRFAECRAEIMHLVDVGQLEWTTERKLIVSGKRSIATA